LTSASTTAAGGTCFSKHIIKTNPDARTAYVCAVCKHCIPGDITPKQCAKVSQAFNDLRGSPVSTEPPKGDSGYFQYMPSHNLRQPPQFTSHAGSGYIPGTTAAWETFLLADGANSVPPGVIPSDIIPDVAHEVRSDLHHANDDIAAGLSQAKGLNYAERAKIEGNVASKLDQAEKEISYGLAKADNAILHANDQVSVALAHADDQAAAGLMHADEEIAAHVDHNPNVPADVPSYIPVLGGNPHPVSSSIPTASSSVVANDKIEGTNVLWSKYLPGHDGQQVVHGSDPLEYVPQVAAEGQDSGRSRMGPGERRALNACMRTGCSRTLGSGSLRASGLTHCIQGSKSMVAATECFRQFPSPQGEALHTCMICQHCLPGSVSPDKCRVLERNPDDVRGW